jgi:hypothetical protein
MPATFMSSGAGVGRFAKSCGMTASGCPYTQNVWKGAFCVAGRKGRDGRYIGFGNGLPA